MRRRLEEAAGVDAQFEATQRTETPLEFLLREMRDTIVRADRFQAAKATAPFCHPQLQAVAHWFRDRHSHNGRFRISSAPYSGTPRRNGGRPRIGEKGAELMRKLRAGRRALTRTV